MTNWTERVTLAFPVDLFGTPEDTIAAINHLSHIVDPDSGGLDTFAADRIQNNYFIAESQFTEAFIGFLGADVATWQTVLAARAELKRAEPLSPEAVATLHDGLCFGDAAHAAVDEHHELPA